MTARLDFLEQAALSALALSFSGSGLSDAGLIAASAPARGFLDLHRAPDGVTVQMATGDSRLARSGYGRWTAEGIVVATTEQAAALHVDLTAPAVAIKRLHLRWRGDLSDTRLMLGDAWERRYGDLEWRG